MEYAPIIIPTCCRPEHLRRCIESLASSSIAKDTDLLLSVDYPPYARMFEGYEGVKQYLDSGVQGFRSVEVIYQETNLGFYDNIDFLTDLVRDKGYRSFIYTEDDLEFSPCFLDYVNKGLELFKDDPSVFSVCGYRYTWFEDHTPNNVGEIYGFLQWGYGTWIDKYYKVIEQVDKENFESLLRDDAKMYDLAYNRGDEFRYLFEATVTKPGKKAGVYNRYFSKSGKIAHIDQTVGPIMCLERMYSVHPDINMVRNTGFDDKSGHTIINNSTYEYSKQDITTESTFDYIIVNELKSQEYKDTTSTDKITYPPAKRAWTLRRLYLYGFKRTVRLIMRLSYKVSKMLSRLRGGDDPTYTWNV